VNHDLVKELGRRCPDQRIATVDQDATIIESSNREALRRAAMVRDFEYDSSRILASACRIHTEKDTFCREAGEFPSWWRTP
jgi:hypothetical protein